MTILEKSDFFVFFSEFSSQVYPLKVRHSKNLMPNLAFTIFPYISKSVYFFRSTFGKYSNYLEGNKIAIFKGKRPEWMTPVSRKKNFSPLNYPKAAQF